MGNVAIHGFGRIGRTLLRIALKNNLFTPVSVSDIRDIPTLAALFEVDTNYGRWHEEVKPTEKGFTIGARRLALVAEVFNLPGLQNEVEENPVWGARFRDPTAVQPPRVFRLGARLDF